MEDRIRKIYCPMSEEKWLHEMNRQGWQLTATPFPYFYRFIKTEPKDIIWRLEFHPEAENREDYISMAEDYGWHCLKGVNSWLYFYRQISSDPSVNEIFSDNASRTGMAEKTVRRRFIPCLFLFACMLILTAVIALLKIHMVRGYCTLRKSAVPEKKKPKSMIRILLIRTHS